MFNYFILILVCQFLGELTVQLLGLPFPGAVVGALMLFIYLNINQGIPSRLEKVANELLRYLSLFFVPAGVGVMAHFHLLQQDLVAILVAIVVSTLIGIGVTAFVMNYLNKKLTLNKG
jgi:holin-like protein